jgi:hypothetical protein
MFTLFGLSQESHNRDRDSICTLRRVLPKSCGKMKNHSVEWKMKATAHARDVTVTPAATMIGSSEFLGVKISAISDCTSFFA